MYEHTPRRSPDFRHDDEMDAEGDLVAVSSMTRDTRDGEAGGVRPTGNGGDIEDTGLIGIGDGRVAALRPLSDRHGLIEQFGVDIDR